LAVAGLSLLLMMLMMNHHSLLSLLNPHQNHCLLHCLHFPHLHYHHQSHYLHPNLHLQSLHHRYLLHCLLNYRILQRKRTGSVHLRIL
jgi:hypothetical protein